MVNPAYLDKNDSGFKFDSQNNSRQLVDAVVSNSLVDDFYDYIAVTYPTASTEVYTYKSGGVSGTTVATITLTFTDSSKEVLTSVAKT